VRGRRSAALKIFLPYRTDAPTQSAHHEEHHMKYRLSALLLAATLMSPSAFAQNFPTRPVTLVAPTTPGSLPDILARGLGQRLSEKWGQPVVVENRAGGVYAIAASVVSNAPADGYTLLITESGFFTIQPHLSKGKSAYSQRDFVPVSGIATSPLAFIAHHSVGAKSMSDLIRIAKEKPRALNYGTAGPGTAPHMGMLLLESMTGAQFTPVHYRGISPAMNDLLSGQIQVIASGPASALPHMKAGSVTVIGVGSDKTFAQLPGVQPVAATVPGFQMSVSFSVFARTGTPDGVMTRINADIQGILKDTEFQKKFLEPQALQNMSGSPAELTKFLNAESSKWEKLIRDTNLSID
jgi:tripartite-type tricarboxylate transporter receptor subunit TctC